MRSIVCCIFLAFLKRFSLQTDGYAETDHDVGVELGVTEECKASLGLMGDQDWRQWGCRFQEALLYGGVVDEDDRLGCCHC